MPRKPKHPCAYPGCGRLTEKRYCEEHEKLAARQYERYGRDPATRNRYGRAWKRIRDSYAKEHPFCEECFKKGLLVPMEQVHHIKPLAEAVTIQGTTSYPFVLRAILGSMQSVVTAGTIILQRRKTGDP